MPPLHPLHANPCTASASRLLEFYKLVGSRVSRSLKRMEEQGKERKGKEAKYQKSYFDVLGICCTSEVPLIEKILKPLNGVQKVTVVVPSKTVIVVHDSRLLSQQDIVKALNQAKLEASIRSYASASTNTAKKWPSPYILACGILLVVSLFKPFFHPLQWLAIAAVLVGIKPIVLKGIAAVRSLTLDINILVLIAVCGAIALKDYSEAAFIVFLFTIAEWLETRASHQATAGMSSLMSMAPQKAVLAETGLAVDVADVKINTIIAVKAGEVIPIDGVVVSGQSEVDEKSLTGESFPVAKEVNSLVWAGTLNLDGYITVRTTALSENSAVAKMARLVEEAQNSRSSTQRLIDSCTKYYTPAVVMVAAAIALVPLIARVNSRRKWFQLALVLLVSACPCALVLSTPVATFCALLKAARLGLLIKGGDVLESLARTRVVAFDKTGTITRGEFSIVEFKAICNTVPLHTLLYWVASIESKSSHPMVAAFLEHARSFSIEPQSECVKDFKIYPGEGVSGEIQGREIYIGNKRIAARALCNAVPNMEETKEGGVTSGYVFMDSVAIGTYALSDLCRAGAAEAIRELKALGIKTAMLTGDSIEAAMHAQTQLNDGIGEVHAELLPEDKVRLIGELKSREGCTTMVGDGMNDAPALALADVGISMGISGSAVAMETSHVTLMSNDVGKIPRAIKLARATRWKIIGNIIFSVVTKAAIVAAAFAGHPLVWAAVLADVGTCLLVILNSMLLLRSRQSKTNRHGCHEHKEAEGGTTAHEHSRISHGDQEAQSCHSDHYSSSAQEHTISIPDAGNDCSSSLQKDHCCSADPETRNKICRVEEADRKIDEGSIGRKRELGRCCSSYMKKACKARDGCCGGQRVPLAEIITE